MKTLILYLLALAPIAAAFSPEDEKALSYSTDCKKCKDKTKPKSNITNNYTLDVNTYTLLLETLKHAQENLENGELEALNSDISTAQFLINYEIKNGDWICNSCGKKNKDGFIYCSKCGHINDPSEDKNPRHDWVCECGNINKSYDYKCKNCGKYKPK